jgi:hypothetical protein
VPTRQAQKNFAKKDWENGNSKTKYFFPSEVDGCNMCTDKQVQFFTDCPTVIFCPDVFPSVYIMNHALNKDFQSTKRGSKTISRSLWTTFTLDYDSGVDVMITIFGDFSQFSAKKLAFFQKPML